jgi:hypothetical protein
MSQLDAYQVVLYLHLLSLFAMVGGITLVGVCYFRLRAAESLIDATPWAGLADQTGWLFPPAILGLLVTGAYLTNHMWTWGTPWIAVSIAGLALVTLQGPLVAGPRTGALKHALGENGAGPLAVRTRQLTRDRMLWIVIFANPGIVLGITWNMTLKPGWAGAIAAVLAGYALGAAAALPLTKQRGRADQRRA